MMVTTKNVFWDVTPCSLVEIYKGVVPVFYPEDFKHLGITKRSYIHSITHGVTSEKHEMLVLEYLFLKKCIYYTQESAVLLYCYIFRHICAIFRELSAIHIVCVYTHTYTYIMSIAVVT